MSDPYRDALGGEGPDAPRDRGIVGDVIAQFADPYAFYRELIQNAIDAGSPEVHVELEYDRSNQRMHASVRDKGEGMSREVIENQLLVLFRSTKEKDRTKIGKFGIGFSSVLAPDPEVVVISTTHGGKRLTCHLYRDLSYELFDGGRATHAGTTVDLEISMTEERVQPFLRASEHALLRWCRHASVPIELMIQDRGEKTSKRIDRPLDVEGAVLEVRRTIDNGALTVLAGVTAAAQPYLGFFNHGLMLAELDTEEVGKVSVKVQDSRLGHTLSRDDVRRDRNYDRALATVREVVGVELPAKAAVRLRELAESGDDAEYGRLVDALIRCEVTPASWHFPLLEPRGEARSIAASELGNSVWCSARRSALTAALAEEEKLVLRMGNADLLRTALGANRTEMRVVDDELTLATPVERTDADTALLQILRELLGHVHREPADILIVELVGARGDLLSVGLRDATSRLVKHGDAAKNPFAFFGRLTLALSAQHPHVKAAREREDPILAAGHLARAVLLQHQLLDRARSEAIFERTLAGLGVTP
jgi:molecular chaperone HtpG